MGVIFIGLGIAPIYPGLIHPTPQRFKEQSSKVMSMQMAAGYIGAAMLSPLVGLIASFTYFNSLIFIVLGAVVVLLIASKDARYSQP